MVAMLEMWVVSWVIEDLTPSMRWRKASRVKGALLVCSGGIEELAAAALSC